MDLGATNLSEICRTCKCISAEMISIFEGIEYLHESFCINEMLMACASIQVICGDGLPSHICSICLEQLRDAFSFKRKCETTDASLREITKHVNQDIELKQESSENSDFQGLNEQTKLEVGAWDEKTFETIQKVESDCTPDECIKYPIYECRLCDKVYNTAKGLNRHMQTHGKRNLHICKICNKVLPKGKYMKRHLVTHLKKNPFSCKTCNRCFKRIESLNNHVPRCKGDTVYTCGVCDRMFKKEDRLEAHKKTHDEQDLKLPTIENMDNISDHFYQIVKHINSSTSNESDQTDIKDCFEENADEIDEERSSEFVDVSNLDEESCSSVDRGNENLSCEEVEDKELVVKVEEEIMGDPFGDSKVDDVGEDAKHSESSSNFNTTPKLPKAKVRRRSPTKSKEKGENKNMGDDPNSRISKPNSNKLVCTECGQQFKRRDYLVVHMRRHRGEKPFKCKYCEKGFPRSTDLTAHERRHTGEKTHLCSICGKGFPRGYCLTVHMRTHTGEKPYKCTYCDSAFAQGNDLKAHIRRMHTGERYDCDLCSKRFAMAYLLTQHRRTVHGLNVAGNKHQLQPIKKEEGEGEPPAHDPVAPN